MIYHLVKLEERWVGIGIEICQGRRLTGGDIHRRRRRWDTDVAAEAGEIEADLLTLIAGDTLTLFLLTLMYICLLYQVTICLVINLYDHPTNFIFVGYPVFNFIVPFRFDKLDINHFDS